MATRAARNRCAKLDLLLKQANIKFDPFAHVSDDIVKALRANRKIEAIKLYRQAAGVGGAGGNALNNMSNRGLRASISSSPTRMLRLSAKLGRTHHPDGRDGD